MLGAQALSGSAVAAVGDGAAAQPRPAPQRRSLIGQELCLRRPAAGAPTQAMPVAEAMIGNRIVTGGHSAVRDTQHGVLGRRNQHLDPEFRSHHGHQLFQQTRSVAGRPLREGVHGRTCRLVNQPAASSVVRASSTVRCPYVSIVVVIEAWPRSSFTLSIPAPRRSSQVAYVWR